MQKVSGNKTAIDYDYESVDVEEIRREVSDYMDDHAYNLKKSFFGHKFNV